jgi:hypothetical protein
MAKVDARTAARIVCSIPPPPTAAAAEDEDELSDDDGDV